MYLIIGLLSAVILYFIIGILYSSNLRVRRIEISSENAKKLTGFKIVLLSDLHGRFVGAEQKKLADAILKEKAELVVIAGDMIDAYDNDAKAASVLADKIKTAGKIISVRGNHFYKACQYAQDELENSFSCNDIITLKNERINITYNDINISIDGIDDPIAVVGYKHVPKKECLRRNRTVIKTVLERMQEDNPKSDYRIVVCHRPTDSDLFEHLYDLALCGHTHGGQLALPLGKEIIGDEARLFPEEKKQSGMHIQKKMPLVITSGIGYSNVKIRAFMPPEIIVITFG